MGQVRILQDDVINKIAAGEVVERPASVVKELVENSIDAGATMIFVELQEGGTKSIRITDNGSGMDQDDAVLAFTRHATSKITAVDDLFQISSNGFRGEALASISSISKVTLQTQRAEDPKGTRVYFGTNGEILTSEWSGKQGTQIYIEDLFYNVPARRRFLKAAATEFAHCHELMQALCAINPSIHFKLTHNNREILDLGPATTESETIFGENCFRKRSEALIPKETLAKLIYAKHETEMGKVELLLSPPGFEKPTGKHIYTFANNRWVKDKLLRMGVMRGYHSHILKGRYPVCVLRLTVDPSLVDVNVHPAKTELRFQYASEVQNLIAIAIKQAIRSGAWAAEPSDPFRVSQELSFGSYVPSAPSRERSLADRMVYPSERTTPSKPMVNAYKASTIRMDEPSRASQYVAMDKPQIDWEDVRFIGAFNKCFLFFESAKGLMVMDQHAFHERVLYERFVNDRQITRSSQALLVPEEIQLQPTQLSTLKDHQNELSNFGFEYEFISDDAIEVKALPAILSHRNPEGIFEGLIEAIDQRGSSEDGASSLFHLIVATMACHSAVRAGEELGQNELSQLTSEAKTVDFYHNCPHGRPVFKWFTSRQVEGWFERT